MEKNNQYETKSSIAEIRNRFDQDVDRFSNMETGQLTTLDATFNMELIVDSIIATTPHLTSVLDIGCGAGNYTLKLLSKKAPLDCTLLDLSQPMLDRAKERVGEVNTGKITLVQEDIRTAPLAENQFCTIMAAAVLHHLRGDEDWEQVFQKLYKLLKPGGTLWISDLISQETAPIQQLLFKEKYGQYLSELKDDQYRDHVFSYIEQEDSPRSLNYQIELLHKVGFKKIEILHKNLCFASFGALK